LKLGKPLRTFVEEHIILHYIIHHTWSVCQCATKT